MADNIYSAPESSLDEVHEITDVDFYVVSLFKFNVLFVSTLGMYTLYWFYKNWQLIKINQNRNIWPIPRALFDIFFTHSLFDEINQKLSQTHEDVTWPHSMWATIYVLSAIVTNVLDRLTAKSVGEPWLDVLAILLIFGLWLPLNSAQKMVNLSCNDPEGSKNAEFTAVNILFVVLGLAFWAVLFIGLLEMFGLPIVDFVL